MLCATAFHFAKQATGKMAFISHVGVLSVGVFQMFEEMLHKMPLRLRLGL